MSNNISKYNNQKFIDYCELKSVTFFTPTYRRPHCLKDRYEDLLSQTSHDFVWVIVNDGSNDETDDVAKELIDSNELPICLISKPNGGKHSAFKVALEECQTPYFQCMDDDDHYLPKSVERYLSEWKKIEENNLFDIGAIRCLVTDEHGKYIGQLTDRDFPECGYFDTTTLDLNYLQKKFSENWTCYKTAALRSISLFPDDYWLHDRHKFFLESIWQGRFAQKFKCRYIDTVLRIYSTEQPISLTRSTKSDQHYLDMFINNKLILDEQLPYIKHYILALFKILVKIQITRGYLRISLKELLGNTKSRTLKYLYVTTSPISLLGKNYVRYQRNKSRK